MMSQTILYTIEKCKGARGEVVNVWTMKNISYLVVELCFKLVCPLLYSYLW